MARVAGLDELELVGEVVGREGGVKGTCVARCGV